MAYPPTNACTNAGASLVLYLKFAVHAVFDGLTKQYGFWVGKALAPGRCLPALFTSSLVGLKLKFLVSARSLGSCFY